MGDIFRTDQALWYNNGVWGKLGYAVPNFGDDGLTNNNTIAYLVNATGRNLQAVMCHTDADLRVPPSINTLTKIHKLILRARSILAGRQVAPGTPDMETQHSNPGVQDFLFFPTPYFKVRNQWMKEYCGLILMAMSEACQHTENRKPVEISMQFSGLIGQYLQRVYRLMSVELLGVPSADAAKLDFTLSDAQLAAYDPAKYFSATEMIDRVPPLTMVPTEDDLTVLTDGIPARNLITLAKWPSGEVVATSYAGGPDMTTSAVASTSAAGSTSATPGAATGESFAPPPSP